MTDQELEKISERVGDFITGECGVGITVDMLTVLAMAAAKVIYITAHSPGDRKIGMAAFNKAAAGFLDAAYRELHS
jgi:hypothetical protein